MPLTIALHGPSCSGKTTVSKLLAQNLAGSEIRHCGELLKGRAAALGVTVDEINANNAENECLDEETRLKVKNNQGIFIVEGRYLDQVLSNAENVLLLRLDRTDVTARLRQEARESGQLAIQTSPSGNMTSGPTPATSWENNSHAIITTDAISPIQVVQLVADAAAKKGGSLNPAKPNSPLSRDDSG